MSNSLLRPCTKKIQCHLLKISIKSKISNQNMWRSIICKKLKFFFRWYHLVSKYHTRTVNSLGALSIFPSGAIDFGMCSSVKAVGVILADSSITRWPLLPWKAQQEPGCISGCWRKNTSWLKVHSSTKSVTSLCFIDTLYNILQFINFASVTLSSKRTLHITKCTFM